MLTRRSRTRLRTAGAKLATRSPALGGAMATALYSQLVLVVSGVVVARALGPESRGVVAFVVVLSALSVRLGSLGIPLSVTYWIAAEGAQPRALLRSLRSFRIVQVLAVVGGHAALVVLLLAPRSPAGFLWVGFLSLAATAASLSLMYGLAVLQGLGRFGAFNALRVLNGTLYVLAVLALWILDRATLTSIAVAVIAAPVVAAAVTWVFVLRRVRSQDCSCAVPMRRLVSFGVRSLGGSAPPFEAFRLDQLLVGVLLAPVALGYYVVALSFTNLSRFIGQSIGMVTFPHVAAADERLRVALIRRDFALGAVVSGAVTLVLIVCVPSLLPFFFGADFAPAALTAQILLVAMFFASVRRILVDGTRGSGRPGWGAAAESLTLLALPAALLVSRYTDSLEAVAIVIAAANLVALLALTPALVGSGRGRLRAERLSPVHTPAR